MSSYSDSSLQMSARPSSEQGEPPRKRVRKGTRSCWECKRRKIRCQLSSEDVPVCSGCLSRGTTCLSQEYPEERSETSNGTQVGERLGRVERLLETLVEKISAYEEEENSQKIMTPESMSNDILTPSMTNISGASVQDNAPFLSLFDNSVIGRRENNQSQAATPASQVTSSKITSVGSSCRPIPKLERIRQALVELLPSQKATNMITKESSSWLLIHALTTQTNNAVTESAFDLVEVCKRHPTNIARTLLYIAVCLQQLPLSFSTTELQLYPSVEARLDKYLSTVQALITSDDELVSTIDGLECLILQGLFHLNAGNPRRAWLTFRRALNICQLMGIHKKNGSSIPGGEKMWYQIVQADRYLALLLGLPAGSVDVVIPTDETFQNPDTDKDLLFSKKICNISGLIIERNQSENSTPYASTQEIDEMLENLAKDMPPGWWDIPPFIPTDHTEMSALLFDRIMSQMWYFQLESLLHLPFMLRAASERRYEYSKFSCLKASREMVYRYLALRTAGAAFCCKIIDFGALTATVTLFLGLLEPQTAGAAHETRQEQESDRDLLRKVLDLMEELAEGGKDVVATQSVNVIKALMAVDSPAGRNTGNLKVTIPYFGTISIVREPRPTSQSGSLNTPYGQQPQVQQQSITVDQQMPNSQSWQGLPFSTQTTSASTPSSIPMVSFTSSQFPPVLPDQNFQNWGLSEADTFFFDSLLNTDIDGNWIL